jgi:hypothetical protein
MVHDFHVLVSHHASLIRDPGARRWQRIPLFLHLRAVNP